MSKLLNIFVIFTILLAPIMICNLSNSDGGPDPSVNHPGTPDTYSPEKINITGETFNNVGVADPSIEYNNGTGYMAYSSVTVPNVNTHLAKSTDSGKTWEFVKKLNVAENDTITVDRKGIHGTWQNEVPTLLYDPDDPGKEWKLFWHKYFSKEPHKKEDRLHSQGYIAYRYASDPEGEWSDEEIVFGMGNYANEGTNLSALHPEMAEYKLFTEPGSLYKDGGIYLSLDAGLKTTDFGGVDKRKIILVRSKDHGRTWEYAGILAEGKDVLQHGYLMATASSLAEEQNRQFLLFAPAASLLSFNKLHDGFYVVEFDDIAQGKLKEKDGKLVIHKRIAKILDAGGQADYDEENTCGGIIVLQENHQSVQDYFSLYSTREKIV
jgi:hypothetical protein